jgi:hypothetical protein
MPDTLHRSVEGLVGGQLSAVAFVQDYVELHFDGPVIRALTNPVIHLNGAQLRFPAAGSRDALCQFIGRLVAKVELAESVSLTCHFQGGGSIIVPLDPDSYRGAEAMHFQESPTGTLQVWN